jgi:hypothetical protein
MEDVHRPNRLWSDARVEAEQKELLAAYIQSLEPGVVAAIQARIAARAARAAAKPPRPSLRGLLPRRWQRPTPSRAPSIQAAVESLAADRSWAGAQRS